MGRVTRTHPVLKVGPAGLNRRTDTLAVEEPLEIRLNAEPFVVQMRTPGADIDLVHGLLHAEGVITTAGDIALARYCDGAGPDGQNTYNVLDITLAARVAPPDASERRQVLTSSACGICGANTVDQVMRDSRYPVGGSDVFDAGIIVSAPDRLRSQQRAFAKTGGLHAAGLMGPDGRLLVVREDVGRHNAVDKVIGWAMRDRGLPLGDAALVVSGRASYELTQKAVLAGIGVLIAVSAPSSLAVELAQRAGLTLVGFVRGESMNVYTHVDRVRQRSTEGVRNGNA